MADDEKMTVTLEEFCALDGTPARDTLRRLIKDNPDFPAKPGTNGVAYEIDTAAAIEWLKGRKERAEAEQRERAARVKQFALDLLGEEAASDLDGPLSTAERQALLQEEFLRIKVAEKRGELISKASIEAAAAQVLTVDARRRETFIARLAKRVELTREQIAEGEALMDSDRREFVAELQDLFAADGSDGGGHE